MSTRTVHQVRFAELADFQRPRAPFSASLCDAFARRADLAALMEHADADQRLPALALAAVHDSVLAEPTSGLAQWYPDIAEHPRTDVVAGALACQQPTAKAPFGWGEEQLKVFRRLDVARLPAHQDLRRALLFDLHRMAG